MTLTEYIDTPAPEQELAEGMEVVVEDELGKRHNAVITEVRDSECAVLATCRGRYRDLVVPNERVLVRKSAGEY